jgi:hypothetical protein
MADGTVGVFDESGAGTKAVDTTEVVVGGNTVERERIVLTGEASDEIARVHDAAPASNSMGLVVRPIVTAGMEADGHSATLGTTTDAAVTTSASGTVSAKLRGLVAILADVWNSVTHKLNVDTGLTQPLTDAQLRASAVPVSAAALPLPSGASTEATLALIKAKTDNIDVAVSTRTKPADQQHTIVDTLPSGSVAAVAAKTADFDTGAGTDTVPMFGVALPKSGGAVAGGTSTDPLRVDPTGTTTQPVQLQAVASISTRVGGVHIFNQQSSDSAVVKTPSTVGPADFALAVQQESIGLKDDAASTAATTGTVNSRLRGIQDTTGLVGDSAVTTSASGTISGKLRGLVAILADIWDSGNHWLKIGPAAIQSTPPANPTNITGFLTFSSGQVSFTRPANTTPYTSGQLVANSTTAGSVVPLQPIVMTNPLWSSSIRRVRLQKSTTSVSGAQFRVHFWRDDPTASTGLTNGDGGALLVKRQGAFAYAGFVELDMAQVPIFSDGAAATGTPAQGQEILIKSAGSGLIYCLIEARGAYTPGNAETFHLTLEAVVY